MKILIFSSPDVPDAIKALYETNGCSRTGKILTDIQELSIDQESIGCDTIPDLTQYLRENPQTIIRSKTQNDETVSCSTTRYYGYHSMFYTFGYVDILDYDETKKWLLCDHDGCESVIPLDSLESVSSCPNMLSVNLF